MMTLLGKIYTGHRQNPFIISYILYNKHRSKAYVARFNKCCNSNRNINEKFASMMKKYLIISLQK